MVNNAELTLDSQPPVAKIIPRIDSIFEHRRVDNYFWLREKDNPEVVKHLEAENAYTETVMAHTRPLQEKLFHEILSRIKETDLSVPMKQDDFYYYVRTEEGKPYPIYCRKYGNLDAPEKILLDANLLAEAGKFFSLGIFRVSPDHKLLAYATDEQGDERYTLRIKDLETDKLLDDIIEDIAPSVEWANDNKTIFYALHDATWRPYKLFRHILGTDPRRDILVYHEKDNSFWLDIVKTKSKAYLFIQLASKMTGEIRYLEADKPAGRFIIIQPRQNEMKYFVDHHDDQFYILTNENAKNFKLMVAPLSDPAKNNWKEIIPHRDSVKIDDLELFREHLILYEREAGIQRIRIRNLITGDEHYIEFQEPTYSLFRAPNPDFNAQKLRFVYESMVTPGTIYDYDMDTRERELKKQREVLGGYNADDYISERIFAKADDGVAIPISLVYKKGLRKDGNNPLLLYGYGAYGLSSDPGFSTQGLSLLDRGFIYAIAHVRGGGEMGKQWHDDGKLLNKMNTFTDFIKCAENLIWQEYTSPNRLIIAGASAGGLLVGAAMNMRPELFKIVIADMPFLDILNTMLDESLPLTVHEYEEWGNPHEEKYYDFIRSYAPYDNIRAQNYPNILATAGLNDTRVQYWEPAKWVAKLRACKTNRNRLLLKTNMGSGHAGMSGRYDRLRETAFEYAFILDTLGITE